MPIEALQGQDPGVLWEPLGWYYDFRFKFQLCHMVKESLWLGVSVNFMISSWDYEGDGIAVILK